MMRINLGDYENLRENLDEILNDEIPEIECAIKNEKIWANGSDGEQSDQHSRNAEDLEEYKAILQYAISNGVLSWDKEIHQIWIVELLNDFVNELEGFIDNYDLWGMDYELETELIETLREIIEEIE